MIAVIARLTAKEGQEAALEGTLRELAVQVRKNEPGAVLYTLAKGQNPRQLIVIERYADQAALDTHGKTPYFGEAFRKLATLLEARPEIEVLNELDGSDAA